MNKIITKSDIVSYYKELGYWECKMCGSFNKPESQLCLYCDPLHTTAKTLEKRNSYKVCNCENK